MFHFQNSNGDSVNRDFYTIVHSVLLNSSVLKQLEQRIKRQHFHTLILPLAFLCYTAALGTSCMPEFPKFDTQNISISVLYHNYNSS